MDQPIWADSLAGTVGVNMFESEDQVRVFVCREFLGEAIGSRDETAGTKRRRRPSRSSFAAVWHEELSSDDDAAVERYSAASQPAMAHDERHKRADNKQRPQGARATSTSPGKRPKARSSRPSSSSSRPASTVSRCIANHGSHPMLTRVLLLLLRFPSVSRAIQ
jgi:hypothetical protein